MIKATQAREKSAIGEVKTQISVLEKKINAAAQSGNKNCFTTSNLLPETLEEVEMAGYKVEKQANGYKISW